MPLLRCKMQLDVHVDGSVQRKEVVRVDFARISVGRHMRHVEDLECKFTGVSWEGTGDGEIELQMESLLPVIQL